MKILSAILFSAFAAVLLSSAKAEARPEAEYGPWGPFWVFSQDWTCPEEQIDKNADLFRAAAYDLRDRVRELLDCGAEINGRNYIGQTPLHWAMYLEDSWMANYLIAEGADPSATRRDGLTAAVAAKINWHRKTSRTCADDEEVNPFNVRECRPEFSCSVGQVEVSENVCECRDGWQEHPFQPGCRQPFFCPAGQTEIADNVCECQAPRGMVGDECVVVSAESCGGIGMVYDSTSGECAESCGVGTELTENKCVSICRGSVHTYYDSEADNCACPPGAAGDHCRELGRSHGMLAVNVPFAHAQVLADGTSLLGKGVTIGVSDPGPLHWVPAGSDFPTTHSELPQVAVFRYDPDTQWGPYDGEVGDARHGIAVLGVMAAKKDGRGLTGIAPESDYLYAVSYSHTDPNIAEGYHNLVSGGASIINSSWGVKYLTAHDYIPADGENVMESARANLRAYVKRQSGNYPELDDWLRGKFSSADPLPAPADRPIFVRSAGNWHGSRLFFETITVEAADDSVLKVLHNGHVVNATVPGVWPGLPEFFPELTLNNLAVAAVQYERSSVTVENGVTLRQAPIAEFSNRCGAGNDSFCLVAPGEAGHVPLTEEEINRIGKLAIQKGNEDDPRCLDREYRQESDNNYLYCRATPRPGSRQPTDGREPVAARHFISLYAEFIWERDGSNFLLAPETEGYDKWYRYSPEGYDQSQGTSFAAPVVSGALALMKQYFMAGTNCGAGDLCGLGSHELVARILATADKRGIYADSSIYGAGLLDLKNALTPQGELQLLSGESVGDSESHSLSQTALQTGPAFGDSIGHALRNVRMAAFDAMNAPFPVSAAGLIQSESESESLREALSAMQHKQTTAPQTQWDFANGFGWWSLRGANNAGQPETNSVFGADDVYANPYSALAGDGMSAGLEWDSLRVAMFGETPGQETLARGAVGSFSFAPLSETTENGGWIFHFGGVDELNGFLSSSGSGAFGDLRSRTAFVGADYVGEKINGWRIRLGGFAGDTSADNGEWFAGTESLRSDSFHLGVERENIFYSGDGLGFRLHQPLRASGSLKIRIPTGRTRYGDLTWREVSGKTSGRELSLEGLYRRSFDGGSLRVSAGAVSEPGHRADAKTIGRMLFAFEREF